MRIFIALLLPEETKTYLEHQKDKIRPQCSGGNFSCRDNYHLTLRFLGEQKEDVIDKLSAALAKTAAKISPFELCLDRWDSFAKGEQNILWIGLQKPLPQLDLLYDTLQKQLQEAGYPPEQKPYSPHLTIARQVRFKEALPELQQKHHFRAAKIALMESCRIDGRLTYLPLAVFPLAGKKKLIAINR